MTQTSTLPTLSPNASLAGQTALVTGAGRGLGAEIALALAAAGAQVFLMSRNAGELDELAGRIAAAGGSARALACDVTDSTAFERALEHIDRLDILINNAGTNTPAAFVDVTLEQLDSILGLNVRAAFLAAQACARKMLADPERRERGGVIVNMSSQMGHVGAVRRSVYCMTKHALEGLTKSMALELAEYRIRVNTVAPTFTETPMTRPFFADPAFNTWVHERLPLGRLLHADEVAHAVCYLASPGAAMITGTSLRIDGGWTAQ